MLELPEIYAENIGLWLPELLYYSITTLKIAVVSFALAVAIGIVFALWRTSRFRVLRAFATAYIDRKSTRLNSSHIQKSRMPSSA